MQSGSSRRAANPASRSSICHGHRGLIHEGKRLEIGAVTDPTRSEELVGSAEPITHPPHSTSRLALFLSGLSGQLPPGCAGCQHCGSFPCCCRACCGGCQNDCPGTGFCCLNCGCSGCVWCAAYTG